MVTVTETILKIPKICCYLEYFQQTSENYYADICARSISRLLNDFREHYEDRYCDCDCKGYHEVKQIGIPLAKRAEKSANLQKYFQDVENNPYIS